MTVFMSLTLFFSLTPCHFYIILIRALSAPKLTFSHPDHSQDREEGGFFHLADANSRSSYRETSRTVRSPNP